jgi:hypothetical protein
VLRRDEIRNERRGCDPTGVAKEAGLFAHSYRVADGDDHAEGTHMLGHGFAGLVAAFAPAGESRPAMTHDGG